MINVGELLSRLGIEAKHTGKEWLARCPHPDHDDKNPSWRMREEPGSDRHGRHHCFACGFSGGPLGLVMVLRGLSMEEARTFLGGSEFEAPVPERVEVEQPKLNAGTFSMPAGVAYAAMGGPFAAYLELRGVPEWQIDRWGLLHAPAGRLAGRIVIPYRTPDWNVVGYTARAIRSGMKRYLEPMPDENPDRSALFGEQHWGDRHCVYVTEGAFNAMALERAMTRPDYFPSVAALAGSEPRPAHVLKLSSFKTVVLMTDADAAGDKAAAKLEPLGRHTRLVRARLPDGKDADSCTQKEICAVIAEAFGQDERREEASL